MAKQAPVKRVVANGVTYTKTERSNGSGYVYRKDGQFVNQQTFAAGVGNYTRGTVSGEVQADRSRWQPDMTVEAPVPDGQGGVKYVQVRHDKASQLGQMANDSSLIREIEVNGTTYSREEIEQAFGDATPVDGQAVRY